MSNNVHCWQQHTLYSVARVHDVISKCSVATNDQVSIGCLFELWSTFIGEITPSKYYSGPILLDFDDQMDTGMSNVSCKRPFERRGVRNAAKCTFPHWATLLLIYEFPAAPFFDCFSHTFY